jgi:hypothetical protein
MKAGSRGLSFGIANHISLFDLVALSFHKVYNDYIGGGSL